MTAFQIEAEDNVATALTALEPGAVCLRGNTAERSVVAVASVPVGHKIAVWDLAADEDIIKYGVVIGRATMAIAKGDWVHLHNIRSLYDERSDHLNVHTGAPEDTRYE